MRSDTMHITHITLWRWPAAILLGALALAGCGSGNDSPAASGNATLTSVAVQTVGAELLPPDAAIAGVDPASLSLAGEELSPDLATAVSADELLPPS
jgi:hypothetical protein